jgi:hypothetical protein
LIGQGLRGEALRQQRGAAGHGDQLSACVHCAASPLERWGREQREARN